MTAATFRDEGSAGSPVTISELVLVYRRHAQKYYRKNGKATRETDACSRQLVLVGLGLIADTLPRSALAIVKARRFNRAVANDITSLSFATSLEAAISAN